jgi:nucleotide-binding universal stress UspA family protein
MQEGNSMKVLLATDGTKFADAAAAMLQNLDLNSADEVKVISVVDIDVPMAIDVYGGYLPDTSELEKAARDNAQKVVEGTAKKVGELLADKNVAVTSDVLYGTPESLIVETAEEMHADLIVLGSHGYKTWERMLLGSVSHSVVHHANCSVLVVRTNE